MSKPGDVVRLKGQSVSLTVLGVDRVGMVSVGWFKPCGEFERGSFHSEVLEEVEPVVISAHPLSGS